MLLNTEQVKWFLPHRDPFLFIDSIDQIISSTGESVSNAEEFEMEVGVEIHASFYLSEDHPILKGHFPGRPILPGVVQTEMVGQAASFMSYPLKVKNNAGQVDVALLGVDRSRYRKPIYPGMNLEIKVKLVKTRGSFQTHEGTIFHNGAIMSETSLLAKLEVI